MNLFLSWNFGKVGKVFSMSKKNRVQIFLSEENQKVFNEFKRELEKVVMARATESQVGNYMISVLVKEARKESLPSP